MKKIYIILITILASFASSSAANPREMRFHCENDTIEINKLLRQGIESGIKDGNKLVAFYGNALINHPYVAHTLEGDQELLTINIDELDCTTFIESLYALARTTLDNRYSWRDYAHNLENIRYRGGKMNGYASRLHYISDWIAENSHRGNVKEITADMKGARFMVKSIDFMTKHRDKYPAMSDDETFQNVKNAEIGYRNHRFPCIKGEWTNIKNLSKELKDGDFVAIVTKIEGLDVQHMGIIVTENGEPYLLNASSAAMKVRIEKENILEYLRHNKTGIGIRVFRITE